MRERPLILLAALAAASEPDLGRGALERLKRGVRERQAEDPMGTAAATVLAASWLFYRAERGTNPKVRSFYDALVHVSTSLSVGRDGDFASTSTGKALTSAVATVGPAMAARLFDEPRAAAKGEADTQAIVERLDRILAALEAQRAAG